ncbi:hypothetical protein [Roseinatronobacter sp. S2]|uniref:hypothetical protein n=1 Tax=Roseinatronobacter sp. S2 TaxID=3035471 RepID=UPI00240F1A8B|nr:hypothetical protein [Roseinatronobacter sp. S2]WFE77295.1 hypothetical protein P8S53_21240 [Roseinatronobacter sp. S2]
MAPIACCGHDERARAMHSMHNLKKRAVTALLCVALAVWLVIPTANHVPTIIETLQDHAEMVATHGHSHGLEEDIYWAMHGHSHEAADHDHSQAFLMLPVASAPAVGDEGMWRLKPVPWGSSRNFGIERPPRV